MIQTWSLLWLIPALPLLGALILGALSLGSATGKHGPHRGLVALLAVVLPTASFVLTILAALALAKMPGLRGDNLALGFTCWDWFSVAGQGGFTLSFGLLFDHLASLMLLFVTGIGALIVLYSVGYMWADRGFARFMAYMNLFLFSMIMLVLGDSLPVTFLGWEGVGLCSYLLIGFWHQNGEYNDAARKAFVVNRVGDLGFLLGAFLLVAITASLGHGTLTYRDLADLFQDPTKRDVILSHGGLLGAACLLIFLGCTGKSAQIPLVTWLPDAMAGPTPVSALIHAATMVTAGVFLLARLSDMFVLAPSWVLDTVLIVGCLTAVWGAIAGLVQVDIKKALAYSTVSQLGFMFMACGVGAFDIALFHVVTHAFFKATLFLGAGSVIHATHHEQDMRKMGGLRKLLPATYAAMTCAWAAIIGIPLTSGFWSKEQIFHGLFHANGLGPVIGLIAVATALLTAVYMTRVMYLAFWSPSRLAPELNGHVHEAPVSMVIPLMVLGFGSLIAGSLWMPLGPILAVPLVGDAGLPTDLLPRYLDTVLGHAQQIIASAHAGGAEVAAAAPETHGLSSYLLPLIGTICAAIGWFVARAVWRRGPVTPDLGPLAGFAATWTWLFDRFVNEPTMLLVRVVSNVLWAVDWIVHGLAWLLAATIRFIGDGYALVQRPRVRISLALSASGILIFAALVVGNALLFWALLAAAVLAVIAVITAEILS